MYIPTRDQSPLHMLTSSESKVPNNAFLSPQWGGIQVYNVQVPENVSLPYPTDVDMKAMMETVVSQLRLLLGVATTQQVNYFLVSTTLLPQWLERNCVSLCITTQSPEEIKIAVCNDQADCPFHLKPDVSPGDFASLEKSMVKHDTECLFWDQVSFKHQT